jgi:hypothetical protein
MRTHQALGLTAATLLVAAPLMMMPTAASAFDIGGLVQGAIGRYAGQGYRVNLGGGAHYSGVHVGPRHSRSSDDDDADAMSESSNRPPSKDNGMAPLRVQDGDRTMLQKSDPMKVMSTGRSDSDELTFAPSR